MEYIGVDVKSYCTETKLRKTNSAEILFDPSQHTFPVFSLNSSKRESKLS